MAALRICAAVLLCGLGCLTLPVSRAWSAAPTADQVKAVFVFNFSHFVQWPPETFASPSEPFVIGVLGGFQQAALLEEAVRGEQVEGHPLQVRRFASAEEIGDCQILFIADNQGARLEEVLARLNRRGTLTVSDLPGASRRGVMIQLATERSRIRLLINVEEAQAAGLTISSNLLRPAEIVRTGT
jgi:hypothetical protein